MPERNLDFDTVIDRNDTDCLKYDFAVRRGRPEGVLSYWVADMDYKTSSYIQDALQAAVEHGIYGYSEPREEYFEAVASWMERRHGYHVERKWLVKTPGIVYALAQCVQAYTKHGDAVLIQQPVYYPFSEVIVDNNRRLVSNDLVLDENGVYQIDFEDLENKIRDNDIKLFLFCSPHNPGGRVWTEEELLKIGELCKEYNVILVADEIHQDFVFEGKHHVFASLRPEFADFTVTCTSASKTFNLAGLQTSNLFIPNPKLRSALRKRIDASGYSQLNQFGPIATRAAYEHGEEWLDALLEYLQGNIDYTVDRLNKIPGIKAYKPQGTYLVWFDCRGLGLSTEELEHFIVDDANLWLDGGHIFGKVGEGFQRINVATTRSYLELGLDSLENAVKRLQEKNG